MGYPVGYHVALLSSTVSLSSSWLMRSLFSVIAGFHGPRPLLHDRTLRAADGEQFSGWSSRQWRCAEWHRITQWGNGAQWSQLCPPVHSTGQTLRGRGEKGGGGGQWVETGTGRGIVGESLVVWEEFYLFGGRRSSFLIVYPVHAHILVYYDQSVMVWILDELWTIVKDC